MNEQAIRDAFDLFVANGYPDTYDNFKRLMQTNQVARKDAFDLFVANGYPDTIDNFNSLMGASVDGPVVKKKEETIALQPNQKPVQSPSSASIAGVSSSVSPSQNEKVNQYVDKFDPKIVDLDEGDAVTKLQYLYGDLGFSFEESTPGVDAIKVTTPTGVSETFSWDAFTDAGDKEIAESFKSFLKKNIKQDNLQKFYSGEAQKFVNNQDVEQTIKSIAKEQDDINKFAQDYAIQNKQINDRLEKLSSRPPSMQDALYFSELQNLRTKAAQLEEQRKSYVSKATQYEKTKESLNKSVGAYIENQEQIGSSAAVLGNAYLTGMGGVISGGVQMFSDLFVIPFLDARDAADSKDRFAFAAKELGYGDTDEQQVLKKFGKSAVDAIYDKATDDFKKQAKYGFGTYELARQIPVKTYGTDNVTQERIEKFKEGFWGGALYGTVSSLPAMLNATSNGRSLNFAAQNLDSLTQEIENDEDLKKLPESEKLLIKAPIVIASAVLEEFGLRNVISQKGFFNGVVARALSKSSGNVTAKSFANFVRDDVNSMIARGLLTAGAGAAAEFETGALQQLSETTVKDIYNNVKDKEMFKNLPKTTGEYLSEMAYAGAQEAVGGFILGMPGAVGAAYRKKGFEGMSDEEFKLFESMANDSKIESAYVTSLKARVNGGEITVAEGKEELNDYRNARSTYQQLPAELSIENKKKAMNLLRDRNQLTQSIEGKDASLIKPQQAKIADINKQLEELSKPENNAVQEQTTSEVPLQPEARVGGKVAEGKPQAEPEIVTEEGKTKEEVERKRQEELFDILSEEDKQIASKIPEGDKRNKWVKTRVSKTTKGTDAIEKHNAEDALNTSTDVATRIAAKRKLESNQPFNAGSIADINKVIFKIKNNQILIGGENLIKDYYDAELAAIESQKGQGQEEVAKPKSFFDWVGGLSKEEEVTEEVSTPIETVTKEEVDAVITPEEQEALDQEVKDLEAVLGEPIEKAPTISEEKKQEVVENINKLRELEKEKNKDNLDEQYAIGSEQTVGERIDERYDKQLDLFESIATPAPAVAPAVVSEEKIKTKAENFLDITDEEFPNDHMLGGYAVTDEDGNLIGRISLEDFNDDTIKINEVVSEKRGQRTGNGRKIMEKITKLADENGISLTLVPNVIGEMKVKGFETSQKLKDFYKKFGFVIETNTGRMTRKPLPIKKPAPAPTPTPAVAETITETTEQPSFIQTLKDKIRELGTPKMGLSIGFTPATERIVGEGKNSTKRIVQLTDKYDKTFKKLESTTDENNRVKLAKDLEQIQEQILDGVKKDIIEKVSKIKGVSVRFDDNFTGRWEGKYEPSFNMQLFVKANADANAVNQMLYDLAEQYSQDAFIVTSMDATSKERIKKKDSVKLPLSEAIGNFAVLSPVADVTFTKPLTTQQLSDLAKALNVDELGYSLNRNRLQVGFYPYVDEKKQAQLTPEEQEQEKENQYKKELAAYEKAIESVFGERPTYGEEGTKPNKAFTAELSVKRSSYISAKNAKSADRERFYDRGDVLQEHQKELAYLDKAINAFKKLRDRQIKGEALTPDQKEYLELMAGRLQPVIQSTIDSAKESYEEAKVEVESIADKSINGLNAFVSKFPIKRPSRASIKTINWYGAAAEKLGDGARVNIIVENPSDADKVFNTIDKSNPKKKDKDLRRLNEKTNLGFPKRLIEVRTSNGVIAEMQVISSESYLAKDGIKGFPEDKKSFASQQLKKVQEAIGFKIPDGLGHYFYEIHRDTNVPQEMRDEALRLSNIYYEAFASPESSSLNTTEGSFKFMNDLAKFKQTVDNAEKSSWDKGNDGKAPDSISELTPKSVLKYTKKPAVVPTAPAPKKAAPVASPKKAAPVAAPIEPVAETRTVNDLKKEYKEKINKVKEDKKLTPSKKEEAIENLKAEFSALRNRVESQAKQKVEAAKPKESVVNYEYSVDAKSPIHQSNMNLLKDTRNKNKIKTQDPIPTITIIKGKVIVEYNNFDNKNSVTKIIFSQDENGKWSSEKIKIEKYASPIRETVFFQKYINPQFRTEEVTTAQQAEDVPSNMVLTGNEEVVKGDNMPTVALDKEEFNDDYSFDDMMSRSYSRTSSEVGLAEKLANGEMQIVEENEKGEKVKGNIKIPYINKIAAKKIAKLKTQISEIKGKSKEAVKEKNKKIKELNNVVKSVLNDFRNVMAQNILALYDSLTEDFVSKSKEWYVGANRMANAIANAYDISVNQISGIIAVLSPQNDWFNNVSLAERTVEVLSKHGDTIVNQDIFDKAMQINSKNKESQFSPLLKVVYDKYGNISINDMESIGASLDEQSVYLRAIDQALYSNKVLVTSPSGKYLGVDTIPVRWASSAMISSAISIYRDGSYENINLNLGNGNKVRNFYNNIADPNSKTPYVTADTHALSVAMNLPISAKIATNFGIFSGGNNPLYALVKTAYIDAANIAGILPREIQSVTWEAQRTGINDKNRTAEQKKKNFLLVEELRQNEQTPYERATTIISRNRSKDPIWGQPDRVVTQRTSSGISRELESRANQRASDVSSIRRQQPNVGRANSPVDNAIAKGETNSTEEVVKQYVGNDLPKIFQLIGRLQKAFPNVIVSVDTETFNNILNSEGVRTFISDGVVIYGVTINGDIYINPDVHKSESDLFNTSIHEFGHIWQDFLSTTEEGKKILDKGYSLIKEAVGVDPYITNLYNTQLSKFNGDETKALNEVASILIGNKGAEVVNKSVSERIKDWLSDVWNYISSAFKISSELTDQDIEDMTLDQFIGTALADMLSGKEIVMNDSQLKQLKNPEAAFSTSQNIFDIVSVGRQNGFSDASIKQVLLKRGFKSADIDTVMQVNLNLFDKLPPSFANVEGGVGVGVDLYNQVLNKLIEFQKAYGYKSMGDIRQKAIELLQANPIFKSQTDQIQKELIVGLDKTLNTKANKSVSALIAGIKNDLKQRVIGSKNLRDAQIAMRTFIRNALPKSKDYSQAQINKLTKIITDTTVDSFMAQSERVIEIVEKQIEKMRDNTLREILSLVTKKAQPAKTTTGKRRSKGLDAQGQSFFEAARDIIKAAISNDNSKMMELAQEISDIDAIDEIIAKDLNGETLTTLEQKLLDKAIAFDTFSDLMTMDLDQLTEVLDSLKDERRNSIARLKQNREARALKYNQIRAEADAAVQQSFPILFTEDVDADGNTITRVKDKNDFDADKNAIWDSFNKLKIWDGIKKFSERWSLDSLSKIFGFFRNNIANIEFFTNLYDTKGKFFTSKIYDKLNTMYDSYLGGFYKQQDNLDVLANSIDGITKGYKQIRKMLEIGVHEFNLKGKQRILSGDQMLRLYALSKNSVQIQKLRNMGFTDADMQRIESLLPKETREFADKLVSYFSNQYYESVNSVYSSLNDVNLQYVPNYFPTITVAASVDGQVLLDGNFNGIFNAETAPALRERSDTSGDIDLAPDFTSVVESHFQNMEKYKAFAAGVKEMNALFQSKGFNALMEQTSTKQLFKNLVNYTINPNAGPKVPATLLDKLYNKYTGFALAFKPIQLPKQLTAFIFAYDNYQFLKDKKVPVLDTIMFMVDNAKVIATLTAQFRKAKEISPTFRDRVAKGIEGDVFGLEAGSQTFKSAEKRNTLLGRFLRGFKTVGAAPTIAGDLLSVMSYMAVYNRNIANGMNPEEALLQFNNYNATLQTRRGTEKSTLQTSQHAAVRAFTMFGSTAFLQMNGTAISMQNIMRSIKNKQAPSQTDIRRFVISFGLANFLFTLVANFPKLMFGDDEDEEKAKRAMYDALIGLNLIYQIPIIGSGIEIAVNKARGERMPVEGTVNPITSVYRKIDKGYKETGEWTSAIRPAIELGIGAQLDPLIGVYSGASDGFDENTIYDIMGISQSYRPSADTKKEAEQKDKSAERISDISQFGMTREELKKSNPGMYKVYFPIEAAEDEEKKQEKKRMQPPSSPFSSGSKTPSPFSSGSKTPSPFSK